MNISTPLGGEKFKLQVFEAVKQWILPTTNNEVDSVLFIDVHYDKEMVMSHDYSVHNVQSIDGSSIERQKYLEIGNVPVPSRKKLYALLSYLKTKNDYRYILLDVCLAKAETQPSDSTLHSLIASMDRIVIPLPTKKDGAIADSILLYNKAALAQYTKSFFESDVTKTTYQEDGHKSIALKMYEDLWGHTILEHLGGLYYSDHGLARNSLFQTYHLSPGSSYANKMNLSQVLAENNNDSIAENFNDEEIKDKYILIGDFEQDVHNTFRGEVSGTELMFNSYISLIKGDHRVSFWLFLWLFVVFTILAYLTIEKKQLKDLVFLSTSDKKSMKYRIIKVLSKLTHICTIIGFPMFLTFYCLLTYVIWNEVYDILVVVSLFYILSFAVKLKDKIKIKLEK